MRHNRVSTLTAALLAVAVMALAATGAKHAAPARSARATTAAKQPVGVKGTEASKGRVSRPDTIESEPAKRPMKLRFLPPLTAPRASSSAAYQIRWQSINSGGELHDVSPGYQLKSSAGQAVVGVAGSPGYTLRGGFWYGGATGGCSCPHQSDFDTDGFLTSLDLGMMIDILFAGQPDVQDPGCPSPRADFDCDGFSTSLDLGYLIDHLFAGGGGPCDPCAP